MPAIASISVPDASPRVSETTSSEGEFNRRSTWSCGCCDLAVHDAVGYGVTYSARGCSQHPWNYRNMQFTPLWRPSYRADE